MSRYKALVAAVGLCVVAGSGGFLGAIIGRVGGLLGG
jgi:hypothetical protein